MNRSTLDSQQKENKINTIKQFFKYDSGIRENLAERYLVMGIQLSAIVIFTTFTFLWKYFSDDTSGISYLFAYLWNLMSIVLLIYFSYAFYISLRFSLPRMVSTKNTIGLFLFAILFFESFVLSVLFWILTFIMWMTDTDICRSYFCTGLIGSLIALVNLLSIICGVVVIINRKNLGIGFLDSFGIF